MGVALLIYKMRPRTSLGFHSFIITAVFIGFFCIRFPARGPYPFVYGLEEVICPGLIFGPALKNLSLLDSGGGMWDGILSKLHKIRAYYSPLSLAKGG